jgi:hypothetical protein
MPQKTKRELKNEKSFPALNPTQTKKIEKNNRLLKN